MTKATPGLRRCDDCAVQTVPLRLGPKGPLTRYGGTGAVMCRARPGGVVKAYEPSASSDGRNRLTTGLDAVDLVDSFGHLADCQDDDYRQADAHDKKENFRHDA